MNELIAILNTMDVPRLRKTDLRWLSRNLAIRNRDHPEFFRAMRIIHDLLRKNPS
jgi:hypothetical protein